MNAQFVPRRFREVHVVVARSFLDVGEGQSAIGIGDVDDLIETRDRITDMLCVGQWFFPLLRKCVDAVGRRSASSAVHVSREASKLLPACHYHPFSKYLAEGERNVYPTYIFSFVAIVKQRALLQVL